MTVKRPNLLMIVADQHRWDCVGEAGAYPARTPNLDRLAAEGAFFEKAFTTIPVCGPARQAMLSGRAPDSYGGLWNQNFLACADLVPEDGFWLAGLAREGYSNTLIGKWNVAQNYGPVDFGYQQYFDLPAQAARAQSGYAKPDWPGSWFGDPSPFDLADSATHVGARLVLEQLEKENAAGRPWMIRLDLPDPHLPCRPSAPFDRMYRAKDLPPWPGFGDDLADKPYIQRQQLVNWQLEGRTWQEWSRTVALYLGMISQVDAAVGLLLDRLDQLGLADDTIVIYTSDHGDMCGSHGMLDKHYVLYDDVTRVPLLVRYPHKIRPGLMIKDYVSHLDLAATLADLCQITGVDPGHGQSMLPLLAGDKSSGRDRAVCSSNGQQFGFYAQRSIRTDDWLYVWNLTDIDELYSVKDDPGQLVNLISRPELQDDLAVLRRQLYETLLQRNDPFARTNWLHIQLLQGKKLVN